MFKRFIGAAVVLAAIASLTLVGTASAVPVAEGEVFAEKVAVTTNVAGFFIINTVNGFSATDVVVLDNGGDHLGGENPSVASVEFDRWLDPSDGILRGRAICWRANPNTGAAVFAYCRNKAINVSVLISNDDV